MNYILNINKNEKIIIITIYVIMIIFISIIYLNSLPLFFDYYVMQELKEYFIMFSIFLSIICITYFFNVLRKINKKNCTFRYLFLYPFLSILLFLFVLITCPVGVNKYLSTFSSDKWNACDKFRYMMTDDLVRKKYLVGMKYQEVLNY